MKKDSALSVSYTVVEPNTYLVITADEALLLDYCIQVCERNEIPGLLTFHRQSINGETQLCYDITGKRRLSGVVAGHKLTRVQGEQLFRHLITCFHQLPEYFLRSGMCLLEQDCLFVDDRFNTYLPLVPLSTAPEQGKEELREFFLTLLGQSIPADQPDPYFDRIIKYLIKPDQFSLEKLEELALPAAGAQGRGVAAPAVTAAPVAAPVQPQSGPAAPPAAPVPPPAAPGGSPAAPRTPPMPAPAAKAPRKPPKPAKAPKAAACPPPMAGINIPGAVPQAPAAPAAAQQKPMTPPMVGQPPVAPAQKKERQPGLFGKLRGGKQQPAPAAPKVDMQVESHIRAGGAAPGSTPPAITSLGDEDWDGTVGLDQLAERTVALTSSMVFNGPAIIHKDRRINISAFPFSIGRQRCGYNIPNPMVSQLHATITCRDGIYFIQDEGSVNHTYVDGAMIPPYTPCQLGRRASIRLANEELRFEMEEEK